MGTKKAKPIKYQPGMKEIPADTIQQIKADWQAGRRIQAVKEVRAHGEVGLKVAMDFCNENFSNG